jgi:hypothetical protein
MATESQINASRENAKASTGPKTEEGRPNRHAPACAPAIPVANSSNVAQSATV